MGTADETGCGHARGAAEPARVRHPRGADGLGVAGRQGAGARLPPRGTGRANARLAGRRQDARRGHPPGDGAARPRDRRLERLRRHHPDRREHHRGADPLQDRHGRDRAGPGRELGGLRGRPAYVFKIRSGVTFHDGTPLDAKAVETNFLRQLDEENPLHQESMVYAGIVFADVEPSRRRAISS